MQSALKLLREESRRLLSVNVFVICFCEDEDILSQWRGYGGEAGLSIGFCVESISEKAAKCGFSLAKCTYSNQAKFDAAVGFLGSRLSKLPTSKNTRNLAFHLASDFLPVAAAFKNDAFREEQEWRLISNPISYDDKRYFVTPGSKMLVPRVRFDLSTGRMPLKTQKEPWRVDEDICISSVVVGPNSEQELMMDSVGGAFVAGNSYVGSVSRSNAPFRSI